MAGLGRCKRRLRAPPRRAGEPGRHAPQIDREIRKGRDYVRVVIVVTVEADDLADALDLAWWAFRMAAGEDLAGWDLGHASADVRPGASLTGAGRSR